MMCVLSKIVPDFFVMGACFGLFMPSEKFRTILEVHRVVVIPPSAPDKSVLLEHADNLHRYAVGVLYAVGLLLAWVLPQSVVGVRHVYIDGYSVAVRAHAVGSAHLSPVER